MVAEGCNGASVGMALATGELDADTMTVGDAACEGKARVGRSGVAVDMIVSAALDCVDSVVIVTSAVGEVTAVVESTNVTLRCARIWETTWLRMMTTKLIMTEMMMAITKTPRCWTFCKKLPTCRT